MKYTFQHRPFIPRWASIQSRAGAVYDGHVFIHSQLFFRAVIAVTVLTNPLLGGYRALVEAASLTTGAYKTIEWTPWEKS